VKRLRNEEQRKTALIKKYLIKYNLATTEELSAKDREISDKIKLDVEKVIKDPFPTKEDLLTHIYVEKNLPYVRAIEYQDSTFNEHKI
jgi:TPP-dependent pyruvate/acetoin dehydrogenase alpha subunit